MSALLGSWELFGTAYLVAWASGFALSLLGILVVARDQIFVGLAVSQASALGVAFALVFGVERVIGADPSTMQTAFAVLFAIYAAIITGRGASSGRGLSSEALTGWIYLFAASSTFVILSQSPFGLEEIQRLLTSTFIGASPEDVWVFAAVTVLLLIVLSAAFDTVRLLVLDPECALVQGIPVPQWKFFFTVILGVTLGEAIRLSGMLYAFGALILPGLIAKTLCREVRELFFAAPLVFLIGSTVGFSLAYRFDAPPGQMVVLVLSMALTATRFFPRATERLEEEG